MITRDSEHEVISTLQGEVIKMTLDENSLVHLMKIMTDLYNDPQMAVLREYATNARDAHIEAGNPDPIEVTLPTRLSPTLVIRDYGVGLDAADIRAIYSKYGASTKRETDDQTGSLGLGCKSALTYADQFTIQAVKDGKQTIVSVSRDDKGAGSMTLVEESETDDRNGVTIVVPTRREDDFHDEADKLFRFWPEGSVLINGEPPKPLGGEQISPSIWFLGQRDFDYYNEHPSYVVMGNVPYPVTPKDLGLEHKKHLELAAYVPMGAVHFTPSREKLNMTDLTKRTLLSIGQEFKRHLVAKAVADIDAAPNAPTALRVLKRWQEDLPKTWWPDLWTYQGTPLPLKFEFEPTYHDEYDTWGVLAAPHIKSSLTQATRYKELPFAVACDSLWFYGFQKSKLAPNDRRKLDKWIAEHPEVSVPRHYLLVASKPDSPFLDESQMFNWAEVKAVKLPRETISERGGRLIGSYDVASAVPQHPTHLKAEDFDQTQPIYYYEALETAGKRTYYDKSRAEYAQPYVTVMHHFEPHCTVAFIPPSRTAKFCRTFPQARNIVVEVERRFTQWLDGLTMKQKDAWIVQNEWHFPSDLDASHIDDPALLDAIQLKAMDLSAMKVKERLFRHAGHSIPARHITNPLVDYPLAAAATPHAFTGQGTSHKDHLYLYLNAVYHSRKDP